MTKSATDDLAFAWKVASKVVDPGIPVLTIADLGVLRDVRIVDGVVEATIAPTHYDCPAMHLIALNIEAALEDVGFMMPRIRTAPAPVWTADWITDAGRKKLAGYYNALPAPERRCKACAAPFDYFEGV